MPELTRLNIDRIVDALRGVLDIREDIITVMGDDCPIFSLTATPARSQRHVIVSNGVAMAAVKAAWLLALRTLLKERVEYLACFGITIQPGEHDYGPGYPAPTPTI